MDVMEGLLIATGFFGALTLLYLLRTAYHAWFIPPSVEAHFSPKGGCTDAIVHEIQHARHEILVLAYSFTSKPIAQALVDAKLRGVHVDIVLDHSNEHEMYTDLHFFLEQGLVPLIDPQHAIAHNKVMVLDNRTLLTGSFNFTQHAESDNAENLLVIKGHPELVRAYKENFHAHKSHARPAEIKASENKAAARHAA
ncbi:MAG TPA: phospholipase D family protein [Gemmataceae bacterium]|nr:phospholipase D family protein [Gemmataceae bacterium]